MISSKYECEEVTDGKTTNLWRRRRLRNEDDGADELPVTPNRTLKFTTWILLRKKNGPNPKELWVVLPLSSKPFLLAALLLLSAPTY